MAPAMRQSPTVSRHGVHLSPQGPRSSSGMNAPGRLGAPYSLGGPPKAIFVCHRGRGTAPAQLGYPRGADQLVLSYGNPGP